MRKANYDKFPHISVPGAKACVTGWDDIARRLRESEVLLQHTRCVIVVECYPGVNDAQVLAELAARLTPALALNPREALLPPDQIEALVAPGSGAAPMMSRLAVNSAKVP